MIEEKRIYVVVAGTVQVPAPRRSVIQPPGRQIAQACHAVSKLRMKTMTEAKRTDTGDFSLTDPVTTIVLQARDSAELRHVQALCLKKKKLQPVVFFDTNAEVYGPGQEVMTALAVFATKKQIKNILDYLPLWGV
jgi:peptidyl-tRNA hydrolase